MDLKLEEKKNRSEAITTHVSIPCTETQKRYFEMIKRAVGSKLVNEKSREFLDNFVEKNKGKIDKAG